MCCLDGILQLLKNVMVVSLSPRRALKIGAGLLIVAVVVVQMIARLVDVEGQVLRAQERLIEAVEGREWRDLEKLLAASYADRWGLDAGEVKKALMCLRQQFLLVDILIVAPVDIAFEPSPGAGTEVVNRDAVVRHVVRIDGRGGPFCQEVMARVNALAGPFEFRWEKTGFWPNSWRLVAIDHGALQVSPEEIERVLDWEESY